MNDSCLIVENCLLSFLFKIIINVRCFCIPKKDIHNIRYLCEVNGSTWVNSYMAMISGKHVRQGHAAGFTFTYD